MTWVEDQHDAAARQLRPLRHELRATMGHEKPVPGAELWPVLKAAMDRRIRARCACSDSLTPPPLVANLTAGWIACPACARAFRSELEAMEADDGRCDLCDRPSRWFREGAIQAGPTLFLWNMCRRCSARWGIGKDE
jgi:hypothetical protein